MLVTNIAQELAEKTHMYMVNFLGIMADKGAVTGKNNFVLLIIKWK